MEIRDKDGCSIYLEDRLEGLATERPAVIGRVLALLVEKAGLTQGELRNCEVLDDDEHIYEGL